MDSRFTKNSCHVSQFVVTCKYRCVNKNWSRNFRHHSCQEKHGEFQKRGDIGGTRVYCPVDGANYFRMKMEEVLWVTNWWWSMRCQSIETISFALVLWTYKLTISSTVALPEYFFSNFSFSVGSSPSGLYPSPDFRSILWSNDFFALRGVYYFFTRQSTETALVKHENKKYASKSKQLQQLIFRRTDFFLKKQQYLPTKNGRTRKYRVNFPQKSHKCNRMPT